MRITGGQARGIPLQLPKRGEIRPATDYLRAAVFSSLGPLVASARVLDVFAGTGAYGLEALSRGAQSACFLEKNTAAIAAIRANLQSVQKACAPRAFSSEVVTTDALRWIPPAATTFDLVFCDPPWALWEKEAPLLFAKLATCLAPDACIILEGPGEFSPPIPANWTMQRHLAKGKNQPAALILRPDCP